MCNTRRSRIMAYVLLLAVGAVYASEAEPCLGSPKPFKQASVELKEFLQLIKRFENQQLSAPVDRRRVPKHSDLLKAIKKLDDNDLATLLAGFSGRKGGPRTLLDQNLALGEIVHRGGEHWKRFMRSQLSLDGKSDTMAALRATNLTLPGSLESTSDVIKSTILRRLGVASDVTMLTVLRRLDRKRDPVMILVGGGASRKCRVGYPPRFLARLTNVDSDKRPVAIVAGGNNRSGRQARWRFEVRNSSGKLLPQKQLFGVMRGGLSSWDKLDFGESWETVLDMSRFVDCHVPGKYTVQIVYSDSLTIADMGSIDGIIVAKSIPIVVTVEAIKIELSEAQRKEAVELIAQLPQKGEVKIIGGPYIKEAREFIAPDSAAGKLLTMDWKAAPDLMAAAMAKDIPPTRRAWILGLLYTITEHNNPIDEPHMLGPFSYRHSSWLGLGSVTRFDGASFSNGSTTVTVGKIDQKKQLAFAIRCWQPWIDRKYIKIAKPSTAKGIN